MSSLPPPRLSNTRKKIPWDLHPLDLSPSPPACAVIHRPFFVFPSPSINSPQRYHMHEPWQPTPSTSSSATPATTRCCCRGRRRRRSQPGTRTTARSAGFAHINFFKTKIILFLEKLVCHFYRILTKPMQFLICENSWSNCFTASLIYLIKLF